MPKRVSIFMLSLALVAGPAWAQTSEKTPSRKAGDAVIEAISLPLMPIVFVGVMTAGVISSIANWKGGIYHLELVDPSAYGHSDAPYYSYETYQGPIARVDVRRCNEDVEVNRASLFQSASGMASAKIEVRVPYGKVTEMWIRKLSFTGAGKEVPFQATLLKEGGSFKRALDWKNEVLVFPVDASHVGNYNLIVLGLRNIPIRDLKDQEYELWIKIDFLSGEQKETFERRYQLVRKKESYEAGGRLFAGN